MGGMKLGFGVRNIICESTRKRRRKSEQLDDWVSVSVDWIRKGVGEGECTPYNKLCKAPRISGRLGSS